MSRTTKAELERANTQLLADYNAARTICAEQRTQLEALKRDDAALRAQIAELRAALEAAKRPAPSRPSIPSQHPGFRAALATLRTKHPARRSFTAAEINALLA